MLFSSLEYIFIFLPVVFCLYFTVGKRLKYNVKIWLLLLASLFFYAWWLPIFLPLLLASILVNYFIGNALRKNSSKMILSGGIILNLLPLLLFKYTNFILTNLSELFNVFKCSVTIPHLKLVLPLGISFFTFQQIAYLVDCYRGGVVKYRFNDYALFVSFWPQLIAGPIVHHSDLLPQFRKESNSQIHWRHIYFGLVIFFLGLGKKVLLADQMGMVADWGWGINPDNLSTGTAWIVTLAYTLQLYFDFSGYCDMAMGSAMLFNIRLPLNFNSPYHALSIQDFWRRWHITLSVWLRDYIYIPLGGSRKGLTRTIINVFTTFLIGGIWHGAGWTFIIWGAMHGFALAVNNLWKNLVSIKLNKVHSWIITFCFVHFAWIFFRAPDVNKAFAMIHRMFKEPKTKAFQSFQWDFSNNVLFYLTLGFILIILPLSNSFSIGNYLLKKSKSPILQILAGVFCALILVLYLLRITAQDVPQSPFLYFQF